MKVLLCVFIVLFSIANAQWLLPDIYLPDSLSGLTAVSVLAYNTVENKLYVGGAPAFLIVIDGSTNQKIAKISLPIGGYPGICYNSANNRLYVGGGRNVIVIDGAVDTIIKTISVKDTITGILWDSVYNRIYVSHYYDTLTVIDGTNDSVIATVGVGRNALVLGCNAIGTKIYVGNLNSPYSVSVVSAPGNFLIKHISVSEYPFKFCYNSTNNKAYIGYGGNIVVIDGVGDSVLTTIPAGGAIGLVYNWLNNCIYSLRSTGAAYDTVNVIDGASNSIIARIRVYDSPYALAFNYNDNKVYCSNMHSKNLSIINCNTNTVITTISTDPYPKPVIYSPINNRIYCGNDCGPSVTVIDGTTNAKIATVRVGSYPLELVYNSVSNKIYCSEFQYLLTGYYPGIVHIINGNDNRPITSVTVGYRPMDLEFNPTNNKIYCSNYYSNTVSVIDGATNSIIANVTVGTYPNGMCYNSVNNRIYCANELSDNIKVIDGATNSVIATITTGNKPWKLFYHSGRNKIYSIDSITITVIDGASNTKIKTMSTTNNFTGFCFGYNSQHDKLYIGEMMYAGGQFVGGIEVIDCATDSIIKWIFPGSQVRSICYNPMNDKFYASIGSASGSGSGRIEIYSGVNDSLLKTIYLTSFPTPIFYNPVNNKIYCGTNDGVVVIDGNTDNIITTFNKPVPATFCYNSTRNYLYGSDCYTGGRGKSRLVVIADEMVGVEEKGFKDKDKKGVSLEVRGLGRPKIYCTTGCVSDIDFSLYNIVGQRVYNYYSKGFIGTKVFELDFLPSGVYFAVLSLNNHSEIKKVVIVR